MTGIRRHKLRELGSTVGIVFGKGRRVSQTGNRSGMPKLMNWDVDSVRDIVGCDITQLRKQALNLPSRVPTKIQPFAICISSRGCLLE